MRWGLCSVVQDRTRNFLRREYTVVDMILDTQACGDSSFLGHPIRRLQTVSTDNRYLFTLLVTITAKM